MMPVARDKQEEIVRTYRRQRWAANILVIVFALVGEALWGRGGTSAFWFSLASVGLIILAFVSIYFADRCPNCKRYVNERGAEFCPHCKVPLTRKAVGQQPP